MTSSARFALGLLLAGLAGVGGFLVQRHFSDRQVATVPPAAGTPPTEPRAPAEIRKIPDILPDITLPDRQGVPRSLSEWKGRLLVINFWATWCEPCRREIPLLKTLRQEHAADGLEVVGIALDFDDAVRKYADDKDIDYPLLLGEQGGLETVDAFGMEMLLPFTVFADDRGRILTVKIGELHAGEAEFILARMKDVRAGRLPLEEAREQIAAELRDQALTRARQAGKPS